MRYRKSAEFNDPSERPPPDHDGGNAKRPSWNQNGLANAVAGGGSPRPDVSALPSWLCECFREHYDVARAIQETVSHDATVRVLDPVAPTPLLAL